MNPYSIENGMFVFTLMPSLRCSLNCPHCYLSLDERRNSPIMSLDDIDEASAKVAAYYKDEGIIDKKILCYWYGGEPTEMGIDYFVQAAERISNNFPAAEGYFVKHTILSSLITVDEDWYPIFKLYGRGEVQSSFDGLMRGKNYLKRWDRKIREINDYGLAVSTISVVNNEILQAGAVEILDYLGDLNIKEASFLPFMWNEQNDGDKYDKYAPSMTAYSQFMIELVDHWLHRKSQGRPVPEIGQMRYVLTQSRSEMLANIAGQTMFLMPNGDFVMPDYKDGFKEFMKPFGNILSSSFEQVLHSNSRRDYLRKQVLRDGNPECLSCEHADKCIMEFWKKNREGDECFGAKRFVEYVDGHPGLAHLKDMPTLLY